VVTNISKTSCCPEISYYYYFVFPVLLAHKTLLYYFKIYKTSYSWLNFGYLL